LPQLRRLDLDHCAHALAISPENRSFALGMQDSTILVWDI